MAIISKIPCFATVQIPNLEGKFKTALEAATKEKGKELTEHEERLLGIEIAKGEHKEIFDALQNFKREISPNPKKYVAEKYIPIDNSQKIKEINDDYQKQIDEANTPIPEPIETKKEPLAETGATEDSKGAGKEPPTGEGTGEGGEGAAGITHAETEQNRKEFGLPEYEKQKQTEQQWNDEANERLKKEGIKPVIDKLTKKERLSGAEQVMIEKYKATLDEEVRNNSSDKNLSKAKELLQLLDVAGTEWGIEGRSRQLRQNPFSTLLDFYVSEMESTGADKLTDAQKESVQKDYAEVKAARDKAEKVAQDATAKFEEMKAENELLKQQLAAKNKSKSDKVYTTDGKRDFKSEIKNYKDELVKAKEEHEKWLKDNGIQQAGFSGIVLTPKMAKIILKIAATHVEQVGVKIAEVTKRTWDDIKDIFDGITEDDIRAVFSGKYNEKKLTKSEIVAQMRELKSESILLTEYENLLKGGEPKEEGRKQKRNQRLTDIRKQIDALNKERGTGKYSDEAIAKRAIDANKRKKSEFEEKLRKGEFEKEKQPVSIYDSPEFKRKNPKLYNELLDSQNKAQDSQLRFEKKQVENEMKKWKFPEKARNWFKKFSGTLKTLFASFDASAIAVQNYPMIINNPIMGTKGVARSYKGFLKQKAFDRFLTDIHNSSDWPMIKESIRITEPKSLLESGREEFFPDKFKAVVTIKGKQYGWIKVKGQKYELMDISKPFERQFTMLGNILRVTKLRTEAAKLEEKGLTWEKNPEEFITLGKRINNLSSSSDIPQAFQNEVTRTFIWSSRLLAAKLNMLGISDVAAMIPGLGVKKGYYKGLGIKGQLLSRQQLAAAGDLAKFAVGVVTASYLFALARGGIINFDPDDSGFLDVEWEGKNGAKRSMNFTGGFSRPISLIFQMASGGKRKNGVFKKYGSFTDPMKELGRFVAGKAPPVTRSISNIIAGKDLGGQSSDVETEASKYKMPLAVGQIYKQVERDGLTSLFKDGFLMYIGINSKDSRDYPQSQGNTITLPKQVQEDFDRTGDKELLPPQSTGEITVYRERLDMTDEQKEEYKKLIPDGEPLDMTDKQKEEYKKLIVERTQQYSNAYFNVDDAIKVAAEKKTKAEGTKGQKLSYDEIEGIKAKVKANIEKYKGKSDLERGELMQRIYKKGHTDAENEFKEKYKDLVDKAKKIHDEKIKKSKQQREERGKILQNQ